MWSKLRELVEDYWAWQVVYRHKVGEGLVRVARVRGRLKAHREVRRRDAAVGGRGPREWYSSAGERLGA